MFIPYLLAGMVLRVVYYDITVQCVAVCLTQVCSTVVRKWEPAL